MNYIDKIEKNRAKWLERIKKNDSKATEELYRAYRQPFIDWLTKSTNATFDDAVDIFQESVVAIIMNARKEKLTSFSSTVKSYLFSVGRNLFLYKNRQKKIKTQDIDPIVETVGTKLTTETEDEEMSDRQKLIFQLLQKMRDPCKTILYLFYFKSYKLDQIAEHLNYKNRNVVKSQKVRCILALGKEMKSRLNKKVKD